MTLFMPLTRSDKLHAPEAVRESEMATGVHGPRLKLERRLAAALGIAISAALVEVFGSLWSGSLALLTDAGHVGTDAVALGLSLAALRIAGRPHTPQMSFGYHRIEVLAAFVNAVLLAAIASSLALAVYGRIAHPQAVQGETMFAIGLAGLAANLTIVSLLGRSAQRNINIRGAFLHAYGDTLGSVGVVAGAVLIAVTRFVLVDTLIALFIVVLIGASTVRLLRDSARIILEGTPADLRPEEVAEAIRSIPAVRGVHDLHVWTVTSGLVVLTGHLSVAGNATVQEAARIVEAVQQRLRDRFQITHSTLQVDSLQDEMIAPADVTRMNPP
ncbi:MAG: cation transporter [Methanobacteriota archaeon]|nr:MAG: cation transporter [Euryarchaeota archaeon]TLZ66830.1 MAG: cation transporter [Euryarchaeota archaeon]